MLYLIPKGRWRAKYIKTFHIFKNMGNNCMVMFRKVPLYPKQISLGDNVWLASGVTLSTHDAIHYMLMNMTGEEFNENIGTITIGDNVFVGANSVILPNVTIGDNTIIAAGSVVNKDIEGNGVYGGVPAKYLGSFDSFVEKRRLIK